MPFYKLATPYRDRTQQLFPRGAVLEFEEGQAPSSATLVLEKEAKIEETAAAPETLSELAAQEPKADASKASPKTPKSLKDVQV